MANRRRRRRQRARAPRSTGARGDLPPFFRRRSTLWLIAAVLTLSVGVILGVIADRQGGDGDSDPAAGPSPTLAVELPQLPVEPARLQPAEVVDVIDGDTIDVRLNGREERVRYYGIDTPERGDACYAEARDRTAALAGERVQLLPDARDRDRNGRLLRYVFDDAGASIDARLIAEGLALAWTADGTFRDELAALEAEARAAGAGCLWE